MINCPGSWHAEDGKVQKTNPAAIQGTAAHKLGEYVLTTPSVLKDLDNDPDWIRFSRMHIGKEIAVEVEDGKCERVIIDPDMIDGVQLYAETVLDYAEEGADFWSFEQRLEIPKCPDSGGTADAVISKPSSLIIIDFKYGLTPVDPKNNIQLMLYAAGALNPAKHTKIELVIVQPRDMSGREKVKRWSCKPKQLKEVVNKYARAIASVENGKFKFKVGDWCTWCKGQEECAVFERNAYKAVRRIFQTQNNVNIEKLSIEKIAEILTWKTQIDQISKWLDSVYVHALNKVLNEEVSAIPGFKVTTGRTHRKWKVEEKDVIQKFFPHIGDGVYNKKLNSIAQMEAALKAKGFTKRTNPELYKLVEDLTDSTEGQPKLIPDSEPGIEYKPAQNVFEKLN